MRHMQLFQIAMDLRWPAGGDLSVNSAPETIIGGRLLELVSDYPCHGITLEINEHNQV
ncbi:hypothetical protein QE369_001087 [Agrobacterium larrymoorei]|uniref:Uncharacterized protein n=1 Tax=Agrobacterium larrymoorei TaxID=160699 RepID=A0AAJ2BDI6_9HYPH|nr:hypothetical protein [Agrobacterium larrymoorei]